jgi:hypothetical protein
VLLLAILEETVASLTAQLDSFRTATPTERRPRTPPPLHESGSAAAVETRGYFARLAADQLGEHSLPARMPSRAEAVIGLEFAERGSCRRRVRRRSCNASAGRPQRRTQPPGGMEQGARHDVTAHWTATGSPGGDRYAYGGRMGEGGLFIVE